MIVYRDRTFCTQETCKHFADCSKAATDRVHAKAKLHGLPLSLIAFEECFEPIGMVEQDKAINKETIHENT